MKRFLTLAILTTGGVAVAAWAQDPAAITLGSGNGLSSSNTIDDYVTPQGTILMDQLEIVDNMAYTHGNGNCYGGGTIFGDDSDLQLCDDMDVAGDFEITDVTIDNVGFLGGPPLAMRVGVFADAGGSPDNSYTYDGDWDLSNHQSFTDPIFGLFGSRDTASGLTGTIPGGHYWVMGQIQDPGGDWYYSLRDDGQRGADSYGRDGDRGEPGYGTYEWTSMEDFGYGRGDTSMQVVGNIGGGGFALAVRGSCPGALDLNASGATPGGPVAFVYSLSAGSWNIPGGPCAGLELGIVAPTVLGFVSADGSGNATFSGNAPAAACGRVFVQAVDAATCTASNVVGL